MKKSVMGIYQVRTFQCIARTDSAEMIPQSGVGPINLKNGFDPNNSIAVILFNYGSIIP